MSAARTRPAARRVARFSERRLMPLRDVPHGAQFVWRGRRWILIERGGIRIAAVYCQRGTGSKGLPGPASRVIVARATPHRAVTIGGAT